MVKDRIAVYNKFKIPDQEYLRDDIEEARNKDDEEENKDGDDDDDDDDLQISTRASVFWISATLMSR